MPDGTQKRRQISFTTKREALEHLKQFDSQPKAKAFKLTFGELLDQWIAQKEVAPKTIINYKAAVEALKPLCGKTLLEDLVAIDIEDKIRAAHGGKWIAGECIKVSRVALRYAKRKRLMIEDVAREIQAVPTTSKRKATIIRPDKMRAILSHAPNETVRAFWLFLYVTGARPWSEGASLTWSSIVQLDGGWAFRGAKTLAGQQLRPIPDWFRPIIHQVAGKEYIFPGVKSKGKLSTSYVSKHWRAACKLAGLEGCQISDLRDSYSTLHASEGTDRLTVMGLMGHADPTVAEKNYQHAEMERMRTAQNTLLDKYAISTFW